MLDFANNGAGPFLIRLGLIGGILTGASSLLGGFVQSFQKAISVFTKAGGVLGAFAGRMVPIIGVLTLLIALLPQIINLWDDWTATVPEITEEIQTNNAELENAKAQLDELNDTPWYDRTPEMEAEIQELQEYIEKLEKANEELEKQRQNKFDAEWGGQVQQTVPVEGSGYYFAESDLVGEGKLQNNIYAQYADSAEEMFEIVSKMTGLTIESFEDLEEAGFEYGQKTEEIWVDQATYYSDLIDEYNALRTEMGQNTTLTVEQRERYKELTEQLQYFYDSMIAARDAGMEIDDGLEDLIYSTGLALNRAESLEAQLNGNTIALNMNAQEVEALTAIYPELANQLSNVNNAYYLNVDALSDLMNAQYTYYINLGKTEQEATAIVQRETAKRIAEKKKELQAEIQRLAGLSIGARGPGGATTEESAMYSQEAQDLNRIYQNLDAQLRNIKSTVFEYIEPPEETGDDDGTGLSSTVQEEVDEAEKALDELQDRLDLIDFRITDAERNNADINTIVNYYNQAIADIEQTRQDLLDKGYDETDAAIRELTELWWDYKDKLDEVWKAAQKAALESLQEYYDALADQHQALIDDTLQPQADAYEDLADLMGDYIDEQIAALEAEKDALDDVNENLQDQIEYEEYLDQLARSKQQMVMVWKDGRWQYVNDIDAVSDAQSNLEEYEQKKRLEEQQAALDAEIAILEQYKQEWSDLAKDYEDHNKEMNILQQLGIEASAENFATMLADAQSFADKYMDIMQQIANAQALIGKYEDMSGQLGDILAGQNDYRQSIIDQALAISGTYGQATSDAEREQIHQQVSDLMTSIGGTYNEATGKWDIFEDLGVYNGTYQSGGSSSSGGGSGGSSDGGGGSSSSSGGNTYTPTPGYEGGNYSDSVQDLIDKGAPSWVIEMEKNKGHAQGTKNAKAGLHLLGEKGPELGVLSNGDGVIPANLTNNLWKWGYYSPDNFLANMKGTNTGNTISIANFAPVLPNVKDGADFVEYLKNNFWRQLIQYK